MKSTLGRPARRTPSEDEQLDPERFRILLGTAARVPAVTLAFVATVVTVTMVAAGSDFTGIYAAIAGTWLGLHQVTLTIDGTSLGVLPLVPTALLVWWSSRSCAAGVDATVEHSEQHLTLQDAARLTVAALVGPLLITVAAIVVMQDASSVLPVSPPNAGAALAWVTGVYLLAAVIGIGGRTWERLAHRYAVPDWLLLSVRPALRAWLGMFAMGGLLVTFGLVWSWGTTGELLARGDGFLGVLGLTIMSVLYLPNMIIAASAILTGSTVQFGDMSLSLFEATGGDLPSLPVLAAIPAGPAAALWPVLLAVPATVGALLGRFAAHRTLQARADGLHVADADTAWTVLAAAAQVGVATAVLTWAAGGPLGYFGVVGANWWLAGILIFAWTGLLGLITAQLLMWREGRLVRAEAARAVAGDPVDTEPDDTEPDDTEPDETPDEETVGDDTEADDPEDDADEKTDDESESDDAEEADPDDGDDDESDGDDESDDDGDDNEDDAGDDDSDDDTDNEEVADTRKEGGD